MKLLVGSDDGIFAPGIQTLANTLAIAGHDVTVVCPDRERSATGHGLTIHKPIRAELVDSVFDPKVRAWACSGTPSDCIKLALGALLDHSPDFVLSGINQGANLGTDVLYSGTVSAAMEGVLEGIPSLAFSLASFTYTNFEPGAQFALRLIQQLREQPLPELMLLNVNIPPVPADQMAGAIITRQGVRRYYDMFEKRIDPRGRVYYWLAGEVLEDCAPSQRTDVNASVMTDVQAIRDQCITITPLQCDLTYYSCLSKLQPWLENHLALAQPT
ncbi:5'/3'-nucleotidase SurE [Synechococcales cyanobacterium C]|uniref:5'-nucleotidase SurE n=1 Tax=Petrachloros mirabilis ULC683 TaxID=2781853 RepID=A0A8K2A047_9CYAN|nr:5'/3'-nucleotidase SurE [Petrachloros mirabilis]NCJ07302.1 5'/3'-nucleotidase SurE [Petrachloros mirabilis ULC683]